MTGRSRTRYWRVVFDLAGRDEDALLAQVARILCGPEHPNGPDDCLIEALFMAPGEDFGTSDDARCPWTITDIYGVPWICTLPPHNPGPGSLHNPVPTTDDASGQT